MRSSKYDVVIVGAGIAGPAMAYALSTSSALRDSISKSNQRSKPLRILLIDRSFRTPDRIVGELLQPGGVLALKRLGLERALEGIDAVKAKGYCILRPKEQSNGLSGDERKGQTEFEQVYIPYPDGHEGRSFHHGEFVSGLRSCASSAPGVTTLEAAVSSNVVYCPHTGRVLGVRARPTGENQEQVYLAKLTIFASGTSTFRRAVYLPPTDRKMPSRAHPEGPMTPIAAPVQRDLETKATSRFHGLVLPHPSTSHILPLYQHGCVILIPGSAGPLLLYQISSVDTRVLIDIPKDHRYSKDVQGYIKNVILPNLPTKELKGSLQSLVEDGESSESGKLKLKAMDNPFFPAPPQGGGRTREGAILLGDAWNQRHPLTGGGMTVALWDVVLLASELIKAEKDLFGDAVPSMPATPVDAGEVVVSESRLMQVNGHSTVHDEDEWVMGRWDIMDSIFDRWWWQRKGYAATINILSVALYDLFGGSCKFGSVCDGIAIIDASFQPLILRPSKRGALSILSWVDNASRVRYLFLQGMHNSLPSHQGTIIV